MNPLSVLVVWMSDRYARALAWSWPEPRSALMQVRVIEGEGYLIGRRLFVPDLPEGFELVDRCDVGGNPRPAPGFIWVRVSPAWMARDRHSPRLSMALRCSGEPVEGWWRDAVRDAA